MVHRTFSPAGPGCHAAGCCLAPTLAAWSTPTSSSPASWPRPGPRTTLRRATRGRQGASRAPLRRWRIRGSAGHLTSRLWSGLSAWQLSVRFEEPPELLVSTWVARAVPRRHAQGPTGRGQASSKARQWPCSPAAPRPRGVCFKLGARVCTVPVRALAHRMRPNKSLNSTTSGMPARGRAGQSQAHFPARPLAGTPPVAS